MVSNMNTTNRFVPPAKRRRTRYKDVGPLFWSGAMVVIGLIAGVLYCLLTNRVPV